MQERLKIVHFSDIHLGASFSSTIRSRPEKRLKAQEALLETFKKAVEISFNRNPDAVVIAGDLFDSNDPRFKLERETYEVLRGAALAHPETFLLLVPGGHDHLSSYSPYLRSPLKDLDELSNVKIFNREGPQSFKLPDNRAVFHAFPHATRAVSRSILSNLEPDPDAAFNVAIVHGSVSEFVKDPNDPVSLEEMTLFDYTVLGHWHRFLKVESARKIMGAYSGSLSPLEFGETDEKYIVEVELKRDSSRTTVDINCLRSPSILTTASIRANSLLELKEKLSNLADGHLYLIQLFLNFPADLEEVSHLVHSFPSVLEARIQLKEDLNINFDFSENDFRFHLLTTISERGENSNFSSKEAAAIIEMAKRFALAALEGRDPLDIEDLMLEE